MTLQPGLHYAIDAETYHADPAPEPSLSSSVAAVLLNRSPRHAWTAHPRLNPDHEPEERALLDFGSAAHALLLGRGKGIEVIDHADWRTKAAKEARGEAYAAGKTPILAKDAMRAEVMVTAARAQIAAIPEAVEAFGPDGASEVVLVWRDGDVWCRGMVDRLRIAGTTAVICDFKTTTASAHPAAVSRRLYDMGYDLQAAFYRRGLLALRPDVTRVLSLLLTQETEPPFALSAVTLDPATFALAEKRIAAALGMWRHCLRAGQWPGYPPAVATAELPGWIESAWLEREMADEALSARGRDFHRALPERPAPLTLGAG